jgi:hypothetical protein
MVNFRCILAAACALPLAAIANLAEKEAAHYRIITIPTPEGVLFEAGALCMLGPDRLGCASRIGDIWIADGVMAEDPKPKWTLFASGLHEVLGLAVRPGDSEGWLYATQRGEITRMRDTDGDGRADLFETVSDGWGIDGDYHEYAFGSKFDREGNLWVVLCLTGSFDSTNPYRGWCVRITPDGDVIPTNSGIRSPGGIGFNAEGDVFYTDNQGPWNGTCKLHWLKPGTFAGHPGGNRWFDEPATREAIQRAGIKKPAEPKDKSRIHEEWARIPELMPPAILFPYQKMGQSAAGIACDVSDGKFGPFKRQLFVGDQTHSTVMRVSLEKAGAIYQGACYPFRAGFDSGSLALEFAPDGSLIVYGTDRGWGARGGKPFALQRLVWTGKTPFEIQEMKARPDGFELTFTEPVEPASASNPANYQMNAYTYIYQSAYGSPEVDKSTPVIRDVKVSPDGLRARLKIEGMQIGHVHELKAAGVRSSQGHSLLHDAAYYTLFVIPKD